MFKTRWLTLAGCLFFGTTAQAAPITGLFNTGVNNSGVLLGNNATDPHYTLVTSSGPFAGGLLPGATRTLVADGFPIPPWVANSATSRWITPISTDGDGNGPQGNHIYRTTFDLTGLNPATARITGQWASDNDGLGILLNGVPTGNTIPGEFAFQALSPFTINSGFVAGINTLDFVVLNRGGPTGLRVQGIAGTADQVAAVPEPAAVGVFGLVAAAALGCRRRRAV